MHIIQVQTIGGWKGAQERPGKPCSCHLVNSHAFYKERTDISTKCVAIVNHKHLFIGFSTIKNEINAWKTWRLAWCAMVWPHHALVKIWECYPYVVMHAFHKSDITEEVSWFWEGNHRNWKGIQIFSVLCPGVFFYEEHTPCKSPCSNLAFFRAHLPY